jgi:hypothetical protein
MDKQSIEKYKLPCINCICVPICKYKAIKMIFDQCKLIEEYCEGYVDESSNRHIAVDMMTLSHMINETLNRYFIPCFTEEELDVIGMADCDPDYHISGGTNKYINRTYSVFLSTFKIDLLEVPRTRKFLLPIVEEIVDDE